MADETTVTLSRKDFQTDQEVRWCPGCGDYSILAAMQLLFAELGVRPENLVFVSRSHASTPAQLRPRLPKQMS